MAKGYCETCKTEIEIIICCNSFDCGCMGLPVEPPFCSDNCYNEFIKINENMENNKLQKEKQLEESGNSNKDKFKKVKDDELNKPSKQQLKNHINNGKDTFGV